MGAGKIILITFLVGGAGLGVYLYMRKRNKTGNALSGISTEAAPLTSMNASNAAQNSINDAVLSTYKPTNDYCNPPISPDDPNVELKKYYYRRNLAQAAWDAQGRGMSLDYFIEQYANKMGCPTYTNVL